MLCCGRLQWVINTPDDGAIKWWIGNAAEDGKAATVFARLKVPASDGKLYCGHVLLQQLNQWGVSAALEFKFLLPAAHTHQSCPLTAIVAATVAAWPNMCRSQRSS
jgi:hypothetical protein